MDRQAESLRGWGGAEAGLCVCVCVSCVCARVACRRWVADAWVVVMGTGGQGNRSSGNGARGQRISARRANALVPRELRPRVMFLSGDGLAVEEMASAWGADFVEPRSVCWVHVKEEKEKAMSRRFRKLGCVSIYPPCPSISPCSFLGDV